MSDSHELALKLADLGDFIPATMSLYEGRLVKNETDLFFIAERFSGWEVMEQCALSEVQKVEVSESFMGVVVEIHTSGSHWTLKDIPEGTNVEAWLSAPYPRSVSGDQGVQPSESSQVESALSDLNTVHEKDSIVQQSPADTVIEKTVEISPEDIQKMRQICEMNPSLQNRMSTSLKEPYDGTDEQLRRFLQRNPDALDRVQRLSDVATTLMKGLIHLKAEGEKSRSQLVLTGCGFAIMGVPFLLLFVVFLIESCFG